MGDMITMGRSTGAVADREGVERPRSSLEKIAAFLEAGKTGIILLHVKEGRVVSFEIRERGRIRGGEA